MRKYINGTVVQCDYCGKKRFIRGKLANYGWVSVRDKDYCPKCWEEGCRKLNDPFKDEEFCKAFEEGLNRYFEQNSWEDCKNHQNSAES